MKNATIFVVIMASAKVISLSPQFSPTCSPTYVYSFWMSTISCWVNPNCRASGTQSLCSWSAMSVSLISAFATLSPATSG